MTITYNILEESGRYFLTKENCNEIKNDHKIVVLLKKLPLPNYYCCMNCHKLQKILEKYYLLEGNT